MGFETCLHLDYRTAHIPSTWLHAASCPYPRRRPRCAGAGVASICLQLMTRSLHFWIVARPWAIRRPEREHVDFIWTVQLGLWTVSRLPITSYCSDEHRAASRAWAIASPFPTPQSPSVTEDEMSMRSEFGSPLGLQFGSPFASPLVRLPRSIVHPALRHWEEVHGCEAADGSECWPSTSFTLSPPMPPVC